MSDDYTELLRAPRLDFDLHDQVAVVTGASSGLGSRFASVLSQCGAGVALLGRRHSRLERLAAELRGRGLTAYAFEMDMTHPERFARVLDDIESQLGPVSILVNNAGVPDANYATRLDLQSVDIVIGTNLRGPYLLSAEVARRLIERGDGGRMVNVSSMLAFEYPRDSAASLYAITKSGIVRMTEVLSMEWSTYGINVNAIVPGMFATEMTEGMLERMGDSLVQRFPRKRIGDPSDLDSTLLYLTSASSEFVTGAVIKVHDGQLYR